MRRRLNNNFRIPALALALLGLGMAQAAGQTGHDSSMRYDVKTEVTLTGTVEDVMQVPGTSAMSGTHLSLKTKSETIHVHLGPTAFVGKQEITFAKGDAVAVTGSRMKGDGFEAILARTVKRGNKVITLRDKNGMPRWGMRP